MYRTEVISKLFGRVGWRQEAGAPVVDTANLASKSKRYFQDAHSIISLKTIKETAGEVNMNDAAFNALLKTMQESSIAAVLDGVFNQSEIIEQRLEFDVCDQEPVLMENTGLLVGRQIKVSSNAARSVRVNTISLYFNAAGTFNIYLFNSLKKLPVKTIEVATEADSIVVVEPEDWILNYMEGGVKSGVFYIGYFQSDLGGVKAYDQRPWSWNCANCYRSDAIEAKAPTATDFVRTNPPITSRTYGLNIEFSSVNDYTEVIKQNPQAFDTAIWLQMGARVVEQIMNSVRSNGTERISKERAHQLYIDLNLEKMTEELPFSTGLKGQLNREMKRLNLNFFPKDKPFTITSPNDPCYTPRIIQ